MELHAAFICLSYVYTPVLDYLATGHASDLLHAVTPSHTCAVGKSGRPLIIGKATGSFMRASLEWLYIAMPARHTHTHTHAHTAS